MKTSDNPTCFFILNATSRGSLNPASKSWKECPAPARISLEPVFWTASTLNVMFSLQKTLLTEHVNHSTDWQNDHLFEESLRFFEGRPEISATFERGRSGSELNPPRYFPVIRPREHPEVDFQSNPQQRHSNYSFRAEESTRSRNGSEALDGTV